MSKSDLIETALAYKWALSSWPDVSNAIIYAESFTRPSQEGTVVGIVEDGCGLEFWDGSLWEFWEWDEIENARDIQKEYLKIEPNIKFKPNHTRDND